MIVVSNRIRIAIGILTSVIIAFRNLLVFWGNTYFVRRATCQNNSANSNNKSNTPKMACRISTVYRIIATICKHIVTQEILSCRSKGIRIDESAGTGIVVTALQVVEPGFSVVVVATVADGIDRCQRTARLKNIAPCVILVLCNSCAVTTVDNTNNIALLIQNIHIIDIVVSAGKRLSIGIIDDIKGIITPGLADNLAVLRDVLIRDTGNGLAVTDASHIVGVLDLVVIGLCTDELAALCPVKVPTGAVVVATPTLL